ncbi:unnamed protein product [Parascedosporium putredinis]|uniref:Ureidoglycolate hydrolase n=1 Tax=Parascedosporium putredinis TaxID=1442378 RepID=A0A9P1M6N5_9PEZI|nr:unnamed protein product [Parascedosporium putredinis]CAI7990053.1 unnamed protein product [Parascedosporium putredinis]
MAPESSSPDPYSELIAACDTPAKMQAAYINHRTNRGAQQASLFASPTFPGVTKDHYLSITEFSKTGKDLSGVPLDPRNSITLWGRPPEHILKMASAIPALVNYAYANRTRLVKPMVSYDATGVALTFVPAAGEPRTSRDPDPAGIPDFAPTNQQHLRQAPVDCDEYTYHHLRRDVYKIITSCFPSAPEARYQYPSAHITLGRYLALEDYSTPEKRERWIAAVDDINRWLEEEVWTDRSEFVGEWILGHEKGLEVRAGMLWYGGGRMIMAGEGF